MRALSRLSTLRETASLGAWLAAIARNVANDYHRRSVPKEPLTDDALDQEIQCGTSCTDRDERRNAPGSHESVRALKNRARAFSTVLLLGCQFSRKQKPITLLISPLISPLSSLITLHVCQFTWIVHAIYMPFALPYIEKNVKHAVCCVLSCCIYVEGEIRFPSPTPFKNHISR